MSTLLEQLKASASNLPAPERAELAHYLLDTLEPAEEGAAEAWKEEIARRVAEIRGGRAAGRPVEELLAELRERYP